MGLSFIADGNGRSKLIVSQAPDYIVPLCIAPEHLEDFVTHGRWLVLSMSVWSLHDVEAGDRAIVAIKSRAGLVKLGLRPFDYPNENDRWIPGGDRERSSGRVDLSVETEFGKRHVVIRGAAGLSPIWVSMVDGRVVDIRYGQLTVGEINDVLDRLLSAHDRNNPVG